MTPQELRDRSMHFTVRAVRFARTLPATWDARRVGGQLIDSATSLSINYRAAGRARSYREFTAKLGVVVEETDEAAGWLEMIAALDLATGPELQWLQAESRELLAIFGSGYHTAKKRQKTVAQGADQGGRG